MSKKIPLFLILVLVIVILAAYLRIYRIDSKDVWLDEANTVLISSSALPEIVSRLKLDSSPPFFYLLLHYWMKIFGQGEFAIRTLSAIFGILLVCVLFFVGRRLFTTKVGVYSALIAAISPIQVMYSQEVRMYSLLPLTSILSMYFFIRFIQEKKRMHIFWYVISTIACLYTHNYGIFLLPAQALILLFSRPKRKTLLTCLMGTGCVILAYLPWLPIFFSQVKNGSHYTWIKSFWDSSGFLGSFFQSLESFSPGGYQLGYVALNAFGKNPFLPVFFVSILLLIFIIQAIIKRQITFYWLLLYFLIPLIAAGLISIISSPVYLAGRCDQLVFPAFCLLIAVSISAIKPKALQHIVFIILLIFSFKTLSVHHKTNLKYGNKKIASVVRENMQPGDAILCTSLTRPSLEYYLREDTARINFFSYPSEMADHMGSQDVNSMLRNSKKLITEARFLKKEIRESGSQSGRLFVLYVSNPVNDFLKVHFIRKISAGQIRKIGKFKQSLTGVPVEVMLINLKG